MMDGVFSVLSVTLFVLSNQLVSSGASLSGVRRPMPPFAIEARSKTTFGTTFHNFEASNETGFTVELDAKAAIGGEGKGFRPMEMMLVGAGGCTCFDVVMILKRARQDIQDCKVELQAERAEEDPKIFTKIHMKFTVIGKNLDRGRVEKAVELSHDKYCSATIMLGKTAEITHSIELIEL